MPISEVFNMDCMEYMKGLPDKLFELAIVDPPYGIGESGKTNKTRSGLAVSKDYGDKDWDKSSPDKQYFNELTRISSNQIIWGANHFISKIPYDSSCWIVWDKVNGGNDFADCELAYTSFKTAVRQIRFMWHGFMQGADFTGKMQGNKTINEKRIHPTQKPVALYKWLLKNYAKEGDKILDTHLGSGSSRIAAYLMGFDFYGTEIDKDYFEAQEKRFKEQTAQGSLFGFKTDAA
jgi:site-specific DNA-methyltransferase (adenine-specific)